MCRFVLYSGPPITLDRLTTAPTHSIIHQSYQARLREPLNGDGFGIAWYVPEISSVPAQFRSIQPAWNNVNLLHLARVSRSAMILAHVRAATPGFGISEANCHPFVADRYAFMHNGFVAGFLQLKRRLRESLSDAAYIGVHGTTDSEHLFARFRDNVGHGIGTPELGELGRALEKTIADVVEMTKTVETDQPSLLNLVVADGQRAIVSRFASPGHEPPSLYLCHGHEYVCEDGICRMQPGNQETSANIVASEPLTDDPAWEPVPPDHLLLIEANQCVECRRLAL